MNKTIQISAAFVFCTFQCFGQSYANNWINFDGTQEYYKINVSEEGIYRINYTSLSNAGINVGNINPKKFQLWHRGEEQYLYIEGESDNIFDANDFIEFYGRKNDGWLDSSLYLNLSDQAHQNYSLITDTSAYFLTWHATNTSNKRMQLETDVNFTGYTPAAYFIHHIFQDFNTSFFLGIPNYVGNYEVYECEYTNGEGWFGNAFSKGNNATYSLTNNNIYTSGSNTEVEIVINGLSNVQTENPDHKLKIQFPSTDTNVVYEGYGLRRYQFSRSSSSFSNNAAFTFTSDPATSYAADRNAVSYISVKYPRTFILDNAVFFMMIIPSNAIKTYLEITNFNTNSTTARLYDLTNNKRIDVVQNGSIYQALVPAGSEKICYLTSESQIKNISKLTKINFINYSSSNSDYIIITHSSLIGEANSYAVYRSSLAGGGYNVIVVDIDQLYDQFSYGINKHPLSIRNFAAFVLDKWINPPGHLFLIGKSYADGPLDNSENFRKNNTYFNSILVPTLGYPPSDILLTAGLKGTNFEPAIPTGRLAAKTSSDVTLYLDKVKTYESQSANIWMKNVIHLAGGILSNQHELLKGYLKEYEETITKPNFGGNVVNFYKSSTDPIQNLTTTSFYDLVNNGISLMTFFGHSTSLFGFDINIDEPDVYQNKDKYFLLIALGCYTGNIHLIEETHSEKFVLIPDKCAIGYIASSALGINTYLHSFAKQYYDQTSFTNYGKSIGYHIQQAIKKNEQTNPNVYTRLTSHQITLHGDPALVLNAHALPDYSIDKTSIEFVPEILSADLDSFKLNLIITNIGKAIYTNIRIEIIRQFPNNSKISFENSEPAPFYKDTFAYTLYMNTSIAAGINTFTTNIDLPSSIVEELEDYSNNYISTIALIVSNDVLPIYPYKYSIVPNQTVSLIASTMNPFQDVKRYFVEIDTTDKFNSPTKKDTSLNQPGSIIQWNTNLSLNIDSVVYYWRIRVDTLYADTMRWFESNFIYIKDGPLGWNQSHFPQFNKGNTFQFIRPEDVSGKFEFIPTYDNIRCQTEGLNGPLNEPYDIKYWLNDVLQDYSVCAANAILIAIFDKSTMVPWSNPRSSGLYGSSTCTEWSTPKKFVYPSNSQSYRDSLANLISNVITDSTWVLLYTYMNCNIQSWELNLKTAIESLGAAHLGDVDNNYPYILLGKKGYAKGKAFEKYVDTLSLTPPDQQVLILDTTIVNTWYHGFLTSEKIGPAKTWGSLHWRYNLINSGDSILLKIIGIDSAGNETVLDNDVDSTDMFINTIDAKKYWYLKLEVFMRDSNNQSPPNLSMLRVIYDPVPEAVLNPSIHYTFYDDTLQEGDNAKMGIAIQNITSGDMDSLKIAYKVIDKNRNIVPLTYPLQAPLLGYDTLISQINFNTKDFSGLNYLFVEANPDNDQPEQYHFNNITQIPFYVIRDEINPILDVTFDGTHILDGDIVSTKPNIIIKLNDENKYFALNDTSLFKVYLKTPDTTLMPVYFRNLINEEIMKFTPADIAKGNNATVEYNPVFTKDGTYELRVEANDASDNPSGLYVLSITFEVITKSTITEVMNYPNPFSTSTRFVFILTGSEIPTYFKIQILTISGKVVREITLNELGTIRIGRNITEFAWNGTDEYGDQLANGLYLYRVMTQINGKTIEHRQTVADSYFKKGYGKMYLLR